MAYAEEAVQRGGLAVAASNGRDTIVMCLECPPADNAVAAPNSSDGDAAHADDADDTNSEDDDDNSWQASETVSSLDILGALALVYSYISE